MVTILKKLLATLLLSVVLLTGCTAQPSIKVDPHGGGWVDWDGRGGRSGSTRGGGASMEEDAADGIAIAGEPGFAALAPGSRSEVGERVSQQVPNLRAGSVDDNANWDDYLLYRMQAREWGLNVHDLEVRARHTFTIQDDEGLPVLGARLEVRSESGELLAETQTGADGVAYFFAPGYDTDQEQVYEALVTRGSARASLRFHGDEREHQIQLDISANPFPVPLDILFLIDSTGSMGDEILQLKENMISVAERISSMAGSPDVRFGMTTYRDRGDLFTSRTFDFTPDVQSFIEALRQVEADGGGDYPESLNEGLHNALYLPEWRVEETVSLLFLVADAPPHLDYPQDYDYAQEMVTASSRGIKIFPLASSGLDDQGEYVFRQLAQYSGGKFIFLTYGAEGAPGDETSHHVDDYSVLSLNDLIVRLVQEQLAFLQD